MTPVVEQRILRQSRDDGECIVFTGHTEGGYGRMTINKRRYLVHRIVYEATHGPIPDGMLVCHTCDNRPCFNPCHFFIGNHYANAMDSVAKGRHFDMPGEKNGRAILTNEQVDEIRAIGDSEKQRTIAKQYGVSQKLIWNILRNRAWRHRSSNQLSASGSIAAPCPQTNS